MNIRDIVHKKIAIRIYTEEEAHCICNLATREGLNSYGVMPSHRGGYPLGEWCLELAASHLRHSGLKFFQSEGYEIIDAKEFFVTQYEIY